MDETSRSPDVSSASPAEPGRRLGSLVPAPLIAFLPVFASLTRELHEIASVKRLAFSIGARQIDFWVVMQAEHLPDTETILDLVDRYEQDADAPPIDIHVVSLDRVDEANLPIADVVFER